MAKLYAHSDREHLVPAFVVPDEWLSGWGGNGFDYVYRFIVPQKMQFKPLVEPRDILRTVPYATVQIEKAYREGPTAVLEPYVVLLGGGRWLVGHPEVEQLMGAEYAPV